MLAPRFTVILPALLVLAGAGGAGAQVVVREGVVKDPALYTRTPIASLSFRPYDLGGTLEGKPVSALLGKVSVTTPVTVMMEWLAKPTITVTAPQGLADGVYSVEYHISSANNPASLRIASSSGDLGTCSVQAQTSTAPVQKCEARDINVVDGKLPTMWLEFTSGVLSLQLQVSRIVVNRWR